MKSTSHLDDAANNGAPDPFLNSLRQAIASESLPPASADLRAALLARLDQPAVAPAVLTPAVAARRRTFFQRAAIALVSTAAAGAALVLLQTGRVSDWQLSQVDSQPSAVKRTQAPGATAPTSSYDRFAEANPSSAGLPVEGWEHAPGYENRGKVAGNDPFDDDSKSFSIGLTPPYAPAPTTPLSAGTGVVGRNPGAQPHPYVESSSAAPSPGLQTGGKYGDGGEGYALAPTLQGRQSAPATSTPSYSTRGPRDYSGNAGGQPAGAGTRQPDLGSGGGGGPRPGGVASAPGDDYGRPAPQGLLPSPGAGKPADPAVTSSPAPNKKMPLVGGPAPSDPRPTSGAAPTPFDLAPGSNEGKPAQPISGVTSPGVEANTPRRSAILPDLMEGKLGEKGERELPKAQPEVLAKITDQSKQWHDKDEATSDNHFRHVAPQAQPGEQYAKIVENEFRDPRTVEHALSTFSIDVDTASYANVRRFLNNGQLPPPDAVRLEELVNYFPYKYPQPKGDDPFSVNMEMADCPWQPGHKLLRVGLKGKEVHRSERPASNLVLLVDTSGSMTDANKLTLLKQAFTLMVGELNENDKVTIVTYAGNAGMRLPPTRGDQKETIIAAIDGMQSGGSTHGSAGIELAYEHAAAQFIKGGTNKVILATDGDLNVGITDDTALVNLITKKAETGVFLTVLGVGTGNLKDAKMERLADNGNGIYAYLDSVREARKVLVEEMSGSLVTIAKDVKIQIEFNPAHIQAYRLLGYENRILAHKDFDDDKKDAGEIGAGHSVTALYEVALVGGPAVKAQDGEPLKYQRVPAAEKPAKELTEAAKTGELLNLKLRYKQPEGKESKLLEYPLTDKGGTFNSASSEFQFASSVVAFGLVLRQSEYRGSANLSAVSEIAGAVTGEDAGGHRAEFLDLVRRAKSLRGN
ncbi:von Willebrand factor [Anatilimnocola aggregata]|uniref:von Willebrand factor n=1 Tax=Anatilimnocola aggregata TaxID=2528021 RepID=A0A517YNF3_9BACT|nr:VWA domain-containing protein [Anatilimnocola aggregata]QDU31753.1 von Willebrand factor [Anatilimnocola aggregata]